MFFLSGASSLIYEVLWMRSLGLMLGNSVLAVTSVLAAFMGGLSLGSWLGGRWSDSLRRPLFCYGILELLIGAYCLAFPLLLSGSRPLASALYSRLYDQPSLMALGLLAIGCALMLLPTALMGATYPILLRHLGARDAAVGRISGLLYAANTLGAVAGAAGAGFLLMPLLGMQGTLYCAVGFNLLIGVWACALGRTAGELRRETVASPAAAPQVVAGGNWAGRAVLAAFFLSGLVAMVHQVGWTRALTMSIGSTTYAFSLIVSVYILGLSLGGGLGSTLVGRMSEPSRGVGLLLLLAGLAGLGTTWALGRFPLWIVEMVPADDTGHLRVLALQAGVLALILLPSTVLGGMLLPFVMASLRGAPEMLGRDVGRAYGINTLGTIVGTVLAGFILLPWLGIEATSRAGASTLALAGVLLMLRWRPVLAGVSALALLLAVLLTPRWNRDLVASGMYLYGPGYRQRAEQKKVSIEQVIAGFGRTIYYRDGAAATVHVKQSNSGEVALLVNGKTETSTRGDLRTQQLLAHLPLLLSRRHARVLVIGLGGGITLASARMHPGIEQLDCLEISAAVIDAARGVFAPFNHQVLRPGKGFEMIQGDGRTHLALSGRQYDVISSEPSNPWIAGIANLFTLEFFELSRAQLHPDGLFCQWLHTYRMGAEQVALIVRTFRQVFPSCYLFKTQLADNPSAGDYLLVGMQRPLALSWTGLQQRLAAAPAVRADLARAGIHQAAELFDGFLLGPDALAKFAGDGPINSDDNALLEFSAPHALYRRTAIDQLEALLPRLEPASGLLTELTPQAARQLRAHDRARPYLLRGIIAIAEQDLIGAQAQAQEALKLTPRWPQALALAARVHLLKAQTALARGELGEAIARYKAARSYLAQRPGKVSYDRAYLALNLGRIYLRMGNTAGARREFEAAIALAPDDTLGHCELGLLLLAQGKTAAARRLLERAFELGNREQRTLAALRKLGSQRE